jgi:hypothetical protein
MLGFKGKPKNNLKDFEDGVPGQKIFGVYIYPLVKDIPLSARIIE